MLFSLNFGAGHIGALETECAFLRGEHFLLVIVTCASTLQPRGNLEKVPIEFFRFDAIGSILFRTENYLWDFL